MDSEKFETSQLSFEHATEYYLELFKESVRLSTAEPAAIACALVVDLTQPPS